MSTLKVWTDRKWCRMALARCTTRSAGFLSGNFYQFWELKVLLASLQKCVEKILNNSRRSRLDCFTFKKFIIIIIIIIIITITITIIIIIIIIIIIFITIIIITIIIIIIIIIILLFKLASIVSMSMEIPYKNLACNIIKPGIMR